MISGLPSAEIHPQKAARFFCFLYIWGLTAAPAAAWRSAGIYDQRLAANFCACSGGSTPPHLLFQL
jgi:hypothetical protein